MNCINNETIQRYIDNEATSEEILYVNTHVSKCKHCAQIINRKRNLSETIKNSFNKLVDEDFDIPSFTPPLVARKQRKPLTRKFAIAFAAAAVIVFAVIVTPTGDIKNENTRIITDNYYYETDANSAAGSQSCLSVVITDAEGNIKQYYIE